MHQPYEDIFKHPEDFRVTYRFYTESEGGRKALPMQGYRCDFWYYHELQPNPHSIYMIRPEFEDEQGNVISDNEANVKITGTAKMWVIVPEMRQLHQGRIKVGLKG